MAWRSLDQVRALIASANLQSSLDPHLAYIQQLLIAATARPVDHLYSRLGTGNGLFFDKGWGNLGVIHLEQDMKLFQTWPPPGLKIDYKIVERGVREGVRFSLWEGTFRTPCVDRIYDALPLESRTGRVQFLVPGDMSLTGGLPGGGGPAGAVVHLAATGDQGFSRRLRLAFPLLKQGVCSIVHESPFYGSRRPAAQRGAKLLRVSDLLTLGWATIYESMNVLHLLQQEGYHEGGLCMAGLSMGGVHSCMTAALCPKLEVGVAALLSPRSAAVAYCDGALSSAMAWEPLLNNSDEANNNVLQMLSAAGQPVSVMGEASYALASYAGLAPSPQTSRKTLEHDIRSAWEATNDLRKTSPGAARGPPHHAGLQPNFQQQQSTSAAHPAAQPSFPQESPQPDCDTAPSPPAPTQAAPPSAKSQQQQQRDILKTAYNLLEEVRRLTQGDTSILRYSTLRRLKHCLEVYTDITRFPVPSRPDAAVFVAAEDDAYVDPESVRTLSAYWSGSEMRLVSGGHVTSFLMHHNAFRAAMLDALARVRQPAPSCSAPVHSQEPYVP